MLYPLTHMAKTQRNTAMNYVSLSGNDLVQLAQTGDAGAVGELQRRNAKGSASLLLATFGVGVNIDSPTPQEQTVMNITPQSGAAPVAQNPAPCVNTSTSEDLIALITQQVIAALTQQPQAAAPAAPTAKQSWHPSPSTVITVAHAMGVDGQRRVRVHQ